jgi:hypothetical protein
MFHKFIIIIIILSRKILEGLSAEQALYLRSRDEPDTEQGGDAGPVGPPG